MSNSEPIPFLEEITLNAWPALQTVQYDGWLLRFAGGYTRRANSINPLYPSTLAPLEKIAYCEKVYNQRGLDTVFKLTEAAQPSELDDLLAEQGYRKDALTSMQKLELPSKLAATPPGLLTFDGKEYLTEDWLKNFCRLNRVNERYFPVMQKLLENIVPAKCFMTVSQEEQVVAVGLAVAERGYMGLFDIVTAEQVRKQGIGQHLILALLNWGQLNGATQAYLQVMQDNLPARRLYQKLGFQEIYTYWYRIKSFG
jgi:hypothetical protein